jgi:hypothetical protein
MNELQPLDFCSTPSGRSGNYPRSCVRRTSDDPAVLSTQVWKKERRNMPSAIMHTTEIAQEYLASWKRKDSDWIARLTHPEVHLKSPAADLKGSGAFLTMCERIFGQLEDVIVAPNSPPRRRPCSIMILF